jgi:hypothetical protein
MYHWVDVFQVPPYLSMMQLLLNLLLALNSTIGYKGLVRIELQLLEMLLRLKTKNGY